MSDGPNFFEPEEKSACPEKEREWLLRAQPTLRELSRQAQLRLEGFSISQVAEAFGLSRPTIYERQRILRRLARKNVNRR